MDVNRSNQLEVEELGPLSFVVASHLPGSRPEGPAPPLPTRITSPSIHVAPLPGPVTHFRRLDVGNDGFIDVRDLRVLLAPARVDVRPSAVIAALDRNGDGRLNEEEFRASMKSP